MEKKNQFFGGLIWNYISLAIMSLSGFAFNVLVICFYDAEVLGVFNLTTTWYLVLSQVSVWGIHMSVLKFASESENAYSKEEVVISSIFPILLISVALVIVGELITPFIVTNNERLVVFIKYILPALIPFSINKSILNYLNALERMKAYAVFQSVRYIFIAICITICGALHLKEEYLSFSFLIPEIIIFIAMTVYLICSGFQFVFPSFRMMLIHIKFGTSILPSNMMLELNSKVNIISLGILINDDYLIGVYSFAILFAEGLYQAYVVVRRSINPQIALGGTPDLREKIGQMNVKLKKWLRILSPIAVVLLIVGYVVICIIIGKKEYISGAVYLLILSVAIAINSRMIVWGNILSQNGFPLEESFVNLFTVILNFAMNFVLISICGMVGASIATAISYFVFSGFLFGLSKKRLKINLLR